MLIVFSVFLYILISALVAGCIAYIFGSNHRDLACWLGLFWPVTIWVAVLSLAAALILVVFVGPAYLAANFWKNSS